jgi:hypothetical protein
MAEKSRFPSSLKRLEKKDLLSIKDSNDDVYVVTKQETANVIREFVKNEMDNLSDELSESRKKKLIKEVNDKMGNVEDVLNKRLAEITKELAAFIDYKFDELAERACDMLITRKFLEEVDKRAEQKLLEKQARGKF